MQRSEAHWEGVTNNGINTTRVCWPKLVGYKDYEPSTSFVNCRAIKMKHCFNSLCNKYILLSTHSEKGGVGLFSSLVWSGLLSCSLERLRSQWTALFSGLSWTSLRPFSSSGYCDGFPLSPGLTVTCHVSCSLRKHLRPPFLLSYGKPFNFH